MSRAERKCKNCGAIGTIEEDTSSGYLVCTNCGYVDEDVILTNEAEYTELDNGNSSRNGQFIRSHTFKTGDSISTSSYHEGKTLIQIVCGRLARLENQQDVCTNAERIFRKALHQGFIRGRTIRIVAAACIYVAIRQKKITGYLLVDVAHEIGCGTYELAATALKLTEQLQEVMPVIDPTLYIDRFTDELKFGRLAPEIKDTAIQIIRRFDRDWIRTGRKPSGVCGAAIMLAARIHNVDVSRDTIFHCARVCSATINKRLKEISKTELAKASIHELRENQEIFQNESHELPPSMKIKLELQELADSLVETDKTSQSFKSQKTEENDNFSDDDLKDVDDLLLNETETEKRSALFYTMYKTKLDQMPRFQQTTKKKKKDVETSGASQLHSDVDGGLFSGNEDAFLREGNDEDDELQPDGDFNDF